MEADRPAKLGGAEDRPGKLEAGGRKASDRKLRRVERLGNGGGHVLFMQLNWLVTLTL